MDTNNRSIVAVGMSGGIDSTIAALLLKQQGYKVIGITMKIWNDTIECKATKSGCYGPGESQDIADAKKAADILGIEHHVIDLRSEYSNTVIEYFNREYSQGRTPNPCVMCNYKIKFYELLNKAASKGIDFDLFATGHYARVAFDKELGQYLLKRGIDKSKDQSYFLYRLSQEQLGKILFPLGDYLKNEIKEIAAKSGFTEYLKKSESQNFIEWDDYSVLLNCCGEPGNIVDEDGNVIGKHAGIGRYTVGQRKRLNLAGMKEPFYVLKINPERNEIVAGPKRSLLCTNLIADDLHWIIPFHSIQSKKLHAQIRYRSRPEECKISPSDEEGQIKVSFDVPQEAVTPGQSIVFYNGDIVVGGAIISKTVTGKKT